MLAYHAHSFTNLLNTDVMMKKSMFFVLGLCVPLMLCNCTNKSAESSEEESSNVLGVTVPKVEKFVVITADETPVFKAADENSPYLVNCMEDIESDMADFQVQWSDEKVPKGYTSSSAGGYASNVYAVLGEEGDFYKVSIVDKNPEWGCDIEAGYIRKVDTEDMTPEPVTVELIETPVEWEWYPTVIKKDGKYKNLVMSVEVNELWGTETLEIGVLTDGVIVVPEGNIAQLGGCSDQAQDLDFDVKDNVGDLLFCYPKSLAKLSEEGEAMCLDPAKLTDEQIDQILGKMALRKSEYVKCEYFFPMTDGKYNSFWLKCE